MNLNGNQNGNSPKNREKDECSANAGFFPSDVTYRIFGTNAARVADLEIDRAQINKAQRQIIASSSLLPTLSLPRHFDAKGTEHVVRFRGQIVEKFQHSDGWTAFLNSSSQLSIRPALPTEYLSRLDLQNELFGDSIQVVGITRANRLVSTQPTLRGGEPTENEIRDVLREGMWQRVPMHLQTLPSQLMGTAWWHDEENLVLIDARKPNFKKTAFGVLPIDLILSELTTEMHQRFKET